MKRRKLSSTVSLALLSLSIIAFNVLQLCEGYERFNQSITAVTILLSVLVLVLSLLVSYLNYSEREMKYYECGLKLSALCDEIDNIIADPNKAYLYIGTLSYLKDKYQRIIGECGINHIAIDHKRAVLRIGRNGSKSEKPSSNSENKDQHNWKDFITSLQTWKEIGTSMKSMLMRIRVWFEWNIFDVNFLYWILAFGMPVMCWYLIFKSQVFTNSLPMNFIYIFD